MKNEAAPNKDCKCKDCVKNYFREAADRNSSVVFDCESNFPKIKSDNRDISVASIIGQLEISGNVAQIADDYGISPSDVQEAVTYAIDVLLWGLEKQ